MTGCAAVDRWGDHLYVVVYRRPWRRWFRKTNVLHCWQCGVTVEEP